MAHRIRTSEIAIFCAFAIFSITWLPLGLIAQKSIWQAAMTAHPELLVALAALGLAVFVTAVAILVGGLPLLLPALGQSITASRWGLLALFFAPLLAAAVLVVVQFAGIPGEAVSAAAPNVVVFSGSIAVRTVLILLPVVAIGGSATTVAAAIGRSEPHLDVLRFALLPARVATAALALGLLGAVVLTALSFVEGPHPQVGAWSPLQVGGLLLMLAAVVLAGAALPRGIQAARGQ
jgi:hypothetical protein